MNEVKVIIHLIDKANYFYIAENGISVNGEGDHSEEERVMFSNFIEHMIWAAYDEKLNINNYIDKAGKCNFVLGLLKRTDYELIDRYITDFIEEPKALEALDEA